MGHRVPLSGARIKGGAQWWVPSGWAQPKDTTRVPIPMGSIPVWKANGVRCKVTWLVARGNRLWQSNLWLWKLALGMWNNVSLAGKEPKLACKVEKSPTTYSSARLYTQLGLSSALPTMRGAKQLHPPPPPPARYLYIGIYARGGEAKPLDEWTSLVCADALNRGSVLIKWLSWHQSPNLLVATGNWWCCEVEHIVRLGFLDSGTLEANEWHIWNSLMIQILAQNIKQNISIKRQTSTSVYYYVCFSSIKYASCNTICQILPIIYIACLFDYIVKIWRLAIAFCILSYSI